ncbi:hypothetical protein VN12_26100 [Pirellula sp. SH-Sr6A]|nr:hypothetical protein VN12_26100 [Pirellula sp. SH-Sr6A]
MHAYLPNCRFTMARRSLLTLLPTLTAFAPWRATSSQTQTKEFLAKAQRSQREGNKRKQWGMMENEGLRQLIRWQSQTNIDRFHPYLSLLPPLRRGAQLPPVSKQEVSRQGATIAKGRQ